MPNKPTDTKSVPEQPTLAPLPIHLKHRQEGFTRALVKNVLCHINDIYYRPEFVNFEEVTPRSNPDKPVILAGNHSGMSYPWDAIVFLSERLRRHDYDYSAIALPLVAPMLSESRLTNPYLIPGFWKRAGGVDARFRHFNELMEADHDSNVLIFPEGVPGIGKGFNHKYELQRFATSFIRMALKHDTDVQPFYTINGEYVNPYSYSFEPVNRFMARTLGVPFLPIAVHTILLLILPWMFYYGLPAKMIFVKGTRFKPGDWLGKSADEATEEDIAAVRDRAQAHMQAELTRYAEQYGHSPYRWREFFARAKAGSRYFPFYLPVAWPVMFAEFERQWEKHGQVDMTYNRWSFFRWVWRNPQSLFYYLPILGWVFLLARGYGSRQNAYKPEKK